MQEYRKERGGKNHKYGTPQRTPQNVSVQTNTNLFFFTFFFIGSVRTRLEKASPARGQTLAQVAQNNEFVEE